MLDLALVSSFLGSGIDIIQKLKSEKIVSHEGLVIYHDKNEVEYRIDLNIGDQKSRVTHFKNFFKSKTLKKITIKALEATGTGINNENLIEMGLMQWNKNELTIDFPKIVSDVKSSMVIIIFRTTFSEEFVDKLVHRQVSKVNSIKDGKIVSHFEMILDYANMWYSNYTSFSVRNIIFTMNHTLPQNEIKLLMMEELSTKLGRADKEALKKENARKFILEFQRTILELQKPEFLQKIQGLIEVDPPNNGRITTVIPSLQVYNMEHSRIPLTIPDLFILKISANIEDRETAVHGTITFDLEEFRKILRDKFKEFRDKNRKLKF